MVVIKRGAITFGGDKYDYDIDCGDSFIGMYLFPNSLCCLILNAYSFLYLSDISRKCVF